MWPRSRLTVPRHGHPHNNNNVFRLGIFQGIQEYGSGNPVRPAQESICYALIVVSLSHGVVTTVITDHRVIKDHELRDRSTTLTHMNAHLCDPVSKESIL